MKQENQLSLLDQQQTPVEGVPYVGRHVRHEGKVYFPVVDIISALTESKDPVQYWYDMQRRENTQLSEICRELKIKAANGKSYKMHFVATAETPLPKLRLTK